MGPIERRYEYDETGRLIAMHDGDQPIRYVYDERDNLVARSVAPAELPDI